MHDPDFAMWQIKKPEIRRAMLDFSSSGQGTREVHQLVSDGVVVINALELVDWDPEMTQFLVCEECGITHCEPGGWVSLRRAGSLMLILPAVDYIWGEPLDGKEYGPPSYLRQRGVAYMDVETYESLPFFPAIDEITPLSLKEATLLFHCNAPGRVLGKPPVVQVRSDDILGASEGDHVALLEELERLVQSQYKSLSLAQLRPLLDGERVIWFYLDGAGFIQWAALVFDGTTYRLLVDSEYVIDMV